VAQVQLPEIDSDYDGTTAAEDGERQDALVEKAEDAARQWLESVDPVKMQLRALQAEKELQTVHD